MNNTSSGTCKTIFLYPAAIFASREQHLVTTILGSCVSVCLWDSVLEIGGMNHYMLPLWNGQGLASPKFGNIAIEKLVGKMISMGCSTKNLKAQIFGGGDILQSSRSPFNIGKKNIELAKELIRNMDIKTAGSNVGGRNGRKIIFNTHTGIVKLKFIENSNQPVQNIL